MASISSDKNSNRTIQFVGSDRKRRSVRLGKVTMKDAEAIRTKLETILACKLSQRPFDAETAKWIGGLDPVLADRIASAGLIPPRENAANQPRLTIIGFVDDYTAKRTDVKRSTQLNYGKTRKYLRQYFGDSRRLDAVTQLDAEQFRSWLLAQDLQENTVRSLCKCAKLFFGAAVKGELIPRNPFTDIKTQLVKRTDRMQFVTLEETEQLLDAAPDAEWRAIIALARYGGLRTPSETVAVRWADIDWANRKLLVHSPKTEHHAGKESRWVPLFPELATVLREAFELAAEGADFVVSRYRDAGQNLRTQFEKIIQRAGLTPWQKPFQNLRSSRETELARLHPLHVVVSWMGNSQAVALGHYLQVQDEDFQRAASEPTETAVQNPVQYPAVRAGTASHPLPQKCENPAENRRVQRGANRRKSLLDNEMPPVGLEAPCRIGCLQYFQLENDDTRSPDDRAILANLAFVGSECR